MQTIEILFELENDPFGRQHGGLVDDSWGVFLSSYVSAIIVFAVRKGTLEGARPLESSSRYGERLFLAEP